MFTFWCYCNDISKISNFPLLEYQKFNFQRCFSAESEKVVSISIFALVTKKIKWGKHNKKGTSGSSSVQFSSVTQSCSTLFDPMNHSTPGLPVHHQLTEFTQTHVHRVGDVIQPFHPLSSPSPTAHNSSQHQGLFQWAKSSDEVAKVLEFQLQHQSFQWTPRAGLL